MRIGEWLNRRVALGLAVSIAICAAWSAVGATLLAAETIPVTAEAGWIAAGWAIAALAGGAIAARGQDKRLLHDAVQAVLLLLAAFGCGLCVHKAGDFSFAESKGAIVSLVCGSLAAALLPARKTKKRRGKNNGKQRKR